MRSTVGEHLEFFVVAPLSIYSSYCTVLVLCINNCTLTSSLILLKLGYQRNAVTKTKLDMLGVRALILLLLLLLLF